MRWTSPLYVLIPALAFAGEPTPSPTLDLRPFRIHTATPVATPTPPLADAEESAEVQEQARLLLEIHEKLGRLAAAIEAAPRKR